MEPVILSDYEPTGEFTPAVVGDHRLVERLIAERRANGEDRFDEVWEGSYFMSPLANFEHQSLAGKLTTVFTICTEHLPGTEVLPGVNVSDQELDWMRNYRCPDVAVVLPDSRAKICESHLFGGPDFAVEIVSRGDRSRDKLEFYAKTGVRELLVIDRRPWQLELYRLQDDELLLAGQIDVTSAAPLNSEVLQLTFRLQPTSEPKPSILIRSERLGREWSL